MGVNLSFMFNNLNFYGQFLLDDLNISKQKNEDNNGGFFQNKYAYQLGFKGQIKHLKYLIEYIIPQPNND